MKIATWNVCLGLTTKKEIVSRTIVEEDIDICCIQEAEIPVGFPINELTFKNYSIEVEKNTFKQRVCIYIKTGINYKRREDLENENNHIVIIDVVAEKTYRIICLYRVFSTNNHVTPREKFNSQLKCISDSSVKNFIIMGDFNLDDSKKFEIDYVHKHLFADMEEKFGPLSLIQLVKFPTWSRVINNVKKCSILDHVYTNDKTLVKNLSSFEPLGGDHLVVTFDLKGNPSKPDPVNKRSWLNYSKDSLNLKLSQVDWHIKADDVQAFWNIFENKLINVVDDVVPYVKFVNNLSTKTACPPFIKNKLNKRKRLLNKYKKDKLPETKTLIKKLDKVIKDFFHKQKRSNIRRSILPNNSKSLWDAVKLAKNLNINTIPEQLSLDKIEVPKINLPQTFAEHFKSKVDKIVLESKIDKNVYNGIPKVLCNNLNFMTQENIAECIKSIKIKNNEGFDRIPQRVLVDGISNLLSPLTALFQLIYNERKVPDQWIVSKIIPIFKKGDKTKIENYRPISNLCCASKIFEKLIMKRIEMIEMQKNVDFTGNSQHGFKKHRSTATAGLTVQSLLARALDNNDYACMSSLDLSAAFDVVNVKLLIKRLRIVGLPKDIIELIESWLSLRHYYVSIDGNCSDFFQSETGTVQGSILGPFLYAIYVSPLFDLTPLTNFADDNFVIRWNSCLGSLINDMKVSLAMILKWLKDSGLKVNEAKTEICLFHRQDCPEIHIKVGEALVKSKKSINVLGIVFDSKLQWSPQVANTIKKSKSALHAICLIKKYFNPVERRTLITSNFYSILYYNSEIWHIPKLNKQLKSHLKTASASALKICTPNYNMYMSYNTLHSINKRAQPSQILLYKHAILLYKIYLFNIPHLEWVSLNFNQILTSRQTKFEIHNSPNYRVGNNILSNRLSVINKQIDLDWLNLGLDSFKIKCKSKFLL